ncbi:ABC transporter ATP-binding protein [Tsukamurella sp. 8F]|uniref:ABC transporter ATP-binding protein n=1 Tax=unclassified Tsukamurella TaxID=2633480 RepID=UPI0023B9C0B1|nr:MULTISPECIES: ABC transporter ATP-binding protein [unclassified Tsukamurella]MDF0531979.1 ABC transporter ATP-binding protein [Tsukamurella sp. 8J]MDF0588878.1 ABC transporter ATP-binding protein [Tsukamurella sp. 8F]
MTGTDRPGWIRRLRPYLYAQRRNIALAIGASILGSIAQVSVPLIARQIVDHVIVTRRDPLLPWLAALFAMAAVTFALSYTRRYRGGRVALGVQLDLRNAIHDHLLRLDRATLSTLPTGQLVSRAGSDTTLVQGLLNFLPLLAGNLLMMVASLVVMFVLSPVLALVALIVLPLLFAVAYRMRSRVFPATWDAQQHEGGIAQIVDEDVTGVRVVKAFGQERRELRRLASAAQDLYGSRMRTIRLQARYQPLLEAIPSLAQVAILVAGGLLAVQGHITLGTFLAFTTYVGQFVSPARQLAGVLTIGQQARAGADRIFQLLDLEPRIADRPGAVDLRDPRGEIAFEGVALGFDDAPGSAPVLDGLTLSIAPGDRVAIVGPSGSGKSTMAALLSRFYDPQAGRVTVDGLDVRDLALASLRSAVGVAFEESFLFSDTIEANIAYGDPTATPERIRAAARIAAADGFIRALPRGYDTIVGERGLTLSGGQRQRVALARTILADPQILVLDDATSAVDARTEEEIHDGLREVLAGRTTLLIAHRVSTLHLADRVVMLDGGRVAAQGTHEDLFARDPAYRTLLTGLDPVAAAGDRIEELAVATRGVTESAWATGDSRSETVRIGPPSLGPGLGGGSGGWKFALAATPELLAKVAALPPVRDRAPLDLARESHHDRRFSLGRLLRGFRGPLLLGLLLVVIDALAGLVGPSVMRSGVDHGVVNGSEAALWIAAGVFLCVVLVDLVDGMAATLVTGRTAERIMLSLRVRIWAQLQRLSLDYYEREMAGRIMTRMTSDVDQFASLVQNGLLGALVAGVTFIGVGIALVVIDPELGLITLSVIVPLAVATVWFRRRSARLYSISRDRIAAVNADFQESLSGVREAQAYGHEALTEERFHALGSSYLRSRVQAQRLVATYFPFVQFLSAVADALVLGVGSTLVPTGASAATGESAGALTVGTLIAFLLYIDLFFAPIQQLSQVFDAWQQTRVSVSRIADLMALDTLTPNPDDPETPGRLRGEAAVDRVHFAYRAEQGGGPLAGAEGGEALAGVDLQVAPGETVALVGETGAGKSTVLKLLARFYDPHAGSVTVGGHDLRRLDLHDFRAQLGYVPQESFLFTGTVRDNIAYSRPDASDADVEAAARAVGAHDVIAGLPHGYRSAISERGGSLSAGQRQLIALARAELARPVLLLLDEATANLDLAAEARVTAAMHRVSRDRTTILIAHRLPTARMADHIAVLAHGRVAELGTHDELLAAGGVYARMWQAFETASVR